MNISFTNLNIINARREINIGVFALKENIII